jgi:DNA-binding NarL/FixJ family response regulator
MRVILVGQPGARARLRAELPASIVVVGEHSTAAEATASGVPADAVLTATPAGGSSRPALDGVGDPPVEHLTARELDVLAHLVDGLPNRAIGERLGISAETVKFHVASIMGKLGTSNRVETVRQAVRRGLISL